MFSAQGISTGRLVTQTFTANGTWTAPATTTRVESVSGKGAAGFPGSSGTASTYVDHVTASATGTGPSAGSERWEVFTDAQGVANDINNGNTSGSFYGVLYVGYPNTNTYQLTLSQGIYQDAIPGTAYVTYSGGWQTSGDIVAGTDAYAFVNYHYDTPGSTGASATALGKTFPGGSAGPASTTTFTSIVVTPNTGYPIVVPAGGTITIAYIV